MKAVNASSAANSHLPPIPDVKRRLLALLPGWSDADMVSLFRAAEGSVIDLKAADDPRRIPEPDHVIKRPVSGSSFGGHSNLYYVILR